MTAAEGVSVREAERADLLAVCRIEKASFEQPWPFSAFEGFLGEPGFMVAHDDTASEPVVGYVVADYVPTHGRALGHVKDLAVHPDRRGEGIGRTLLTRALGYLEARGVGSTKLEVRPSNEAARALYREFGFDHHRTVPGYYDDGEDALVLTREA
ncbi:MAG: ribosomal protein S18-alanine N-acetyltransferase [Halobacteriaceae archaeon]